MKHAIAYGLLPLLAMAGCTEQDESSALQEYLSGTFTHATDPPVAIFVITEDGCPACDRAYADLVRARTSCSKCRFIIRADGSSVNLNGFLAESNNMHFDDGRFKQLGLLNGSGFIVLRGQEIDTIVSLRVDNIHEQLSYIQVVLDTLR